MITQLLFSEIVTKNFAFLVESGGYSQEPISGDYYIRYNRPPEFVDVIYDSNRSHEVGIFVGRLGASTPPFELGEVLRASGCPEIEVKTVELIQTIDTGVLNRALSKAAVLLERYATGVLQGDADAFGGLIQSRSDSAAAYTKSIIRNQVAAKAEAAWQRKDYSEVIRILAPHRDQLDETMLRRLRYAEDKQ